MGDTEKVSRAESPPPGMDSLTRLFQSEHFNVRMCVTYLFTHRKEQGVLGYLVNKLYSYPIEDVQMYTPQLICLLCLPSSFPTVLEQYVLAACAKSMHFALHAIWYLESDTSDKTDRSVRIALREKMEIAAINRSFRNKRKDSTPTSVEQEVMAKDRLCEYYNKEIVFVAKITDMSLMLRKLPRPEREDRLKRELETLSMSLARMSINIPIDKPGTPFRRLIRVPTISSYCKVLNSRERAPYLVMFEFIEGGECHDPLELQLTPQCDIIDTSPSKADYEGRETLQNTIVHEGYFDSESPKGRMGSPTPPDVEAMAAKLDSVFGRSWYRTVEAARNESPYSKLPGWGVMPVIVKGGDDMRQEVLAMQLINAFDRIWRDADLPVKLHPYGVIVTSGDSGVIELVTDAVSIDAVKKAMPYDDQRSLADYWTYVYGDPSSVQYKTAQRNFIESMAAYSVLSYILQLKDRHNANILLRRDGCIVHIDFGFMLSNSPGGVNFESMPFKLSQEYVDVMGGINSDMFNYYRVLVYSAFKEATKHADQVISLVDMMLLGPSLPCFGADSKACLEALKSRFQPDGDLTVWVRDAIDQSVDNWRARGYDKFQKWSNGIL
eukprot:TRINITY_DN1862_c0_g1_i1.p1 TRINITY_DN1862_c0_g1~~TRINITY_DN1862_c0_g1_i1.p1  ORF type:complete len:608 (+),score=164.93 TRINITY_DN1862_c0_g1_i1:261-2084(+)